MRAGPKHKFTLAELAYAQDLHDQGITWHMIEMFCGKGLRNAIQWYKRK